ncbi:hypothetical protein BOW53_03045 [Solemya pervernicosa gill symbiont]|uniref:Uncharacterized protein n=1 Tax=Solemya pervernicosa gill symbiont TaxID=642797 RepID=A0A1T2L9C1_9GAMM|nr:hypothetical protein [Solemya pervernicosa gill symbiont]OOZ41670.1 hypothetical protein BOW53_03045 [Solemya pervernicosa gill symbiont]
MVGNEWHLVPNGQLHRLDWSAIDRLMGYHEVEQGNELMRGLHIFSQHYAKKFNQLLIEAK